MSTKSTNIDNVNIAKGQNYKFFSCGMGQLQAHLVKEWEAKKGNA